MELQRTSPPHVRTEENTTTMMRDVCFALLAPTAMAVWYYGLRVLMILAISVATCFFADTLCLILQKKKRAGNISPIVTGMIIAMLMPASVSYYAVVVAGLFAIVVVKHPFGGLGNNIFNPAIAGVAFAAVSWKAQLMMYPQPSQSSLLPVFGQVTAKLAEGPAALMQESALPIYNNLDIIFGNFSGPMGTTNILILLFCAVFLLYRRIITWHIPVSFVGVAALFSLLQPRLFIEGVGPTKIALLEICVGALFFSAVFVSTDPVTSPIYRRSKVIFGAGCGFFTMLFRYVGQFPEGVMFSILMMNALSGFFDKFFLDWDAGNSWLKRYRLEKKTFQESKEYKTFLEGIDEGEKKRAADKAQRQAEKNQRQEELAQKKAEQAKQEAADKALDLATKAALAGEESAHLPISPMMDKTTGDQTPAGEKSADQPDDSVKKSTDLLSPVADQTPDETPDELDEPGPEGNQLHTLTGQAEEEALPADDPKGDDKTPPPASGADQPAEPDKKANVTTSPKPDQAKPIIAEKLTESAKNQAQPAVFPQREKTKDKGETAKIPPSEPVINGPVASPAEPVAPSPAVEQPKKSRGAEWLKPEPSPAPMEKTIEPEKPPMQTPAAIPGFLRQSSPAGQTENQESASSLSEKTEPLVTVNTPSPKVAKNSAPGEKLLAPPKKKSFLSSIFQKNKGQTQPSTGEPSPNKPSPPIAQPAKPTPPPAPSWQSETPVAEAAKPLSPPAPTWLNETPKSPMASEVATLATEKEQAQQAESDSFALRWKTENAVAAAQPEEVVEEIVKETAKPHQPQAFVPKWMEQPPKPLPMKETAPIVVSTEEVDDSPYQTAEVIIQEMAEEQFIWGRSSAQKVQKKAFNFDPLPLLAEEKEDELPKELAAPARQRRTNNRWGAPAERSGAPRRKPVALEDGKEEDPDDGTNR